MQPHVEAQPRPNQPIKRLIALVTRRGSQERPLTGTTGQNSLIMGERKQFEGKQYGENGVITEKYEAYLHRENELTEQRVERGIFLEHEAYRQFLAQSGRTMPDISGLSYWDLTPPDREFINQTYKEYLVQKYTQEYHEKRAEEQRLKKSAEPEKQGEPQPYVSYREYLMQSGRKYIPIYHSACESLSEPDREYVTQTYKEYLVWYDEKKEYRKNLISRLDSNRLLTQEARERLQAHDTLMRQKWNEWRLEEHLKYGDIPLPNIKDGKIMTNMESFMLEIVNENQKKAEAAARGEKYQRTPRPLPLRPIDHAPLTPERRYQRDQQIVRDADYHLSKETNDAQFDQVAEIIQKEIWKDTPSRYTSSVTIKPYHQIDMSVKADGSVINRSKSGTTINNGDDELTFGIGYFTDRTAVIDEAQGLISDEELQKGIKANFILHTYTVEEEGKQVEKTEMIVVPHAYAEHVQLFCAFLHNAAIVISPDEETTDIRRSLQLETRKAPILRRASSLAA